MLLKEIAHELGISENTVRNQLNFVYRRLKVSSLVSALYVLGWIVIPDDGPRQCVFIGRCGRHQGHRGHHGGFRAVDHEGMPS